MLVQDIVCCVVLSLVLWIKLSRCQDTPTVDFNEGIDEAGSSNEASETLAIPMVGAGWRRGGGMRRQPGGAINNRRGGAGLGGKGGGAIDRNRNNRRRKGPNRRSSSEASSSSEETTNPSSNKLSAAVLAVIKKNCKKRSCTEQSDATRQLKAEVQADRVAHLTKQYNGDQSKAEAEIAQILEKTQEAKLKIFAAAGLTPDIVVPADNGLWQGEIPLTLEQATHLAEMADQPVVQSMLPPRDGSATIRAKRSGIFFRDFPYSKWTLPVAYTFQSSFTEQQKQIVRGALKEIEANTCIYFQEQNEGFGDTHMQFIPHDSAPYCGRSYVGNLHSMNPVDISFACSTVHGATIHEVMHALGVHHQQTRVDRDDWITVNYENIDPQFYDWFKKGDRMQFSSYGVEYDYLSVMHYSGYVASINGRPTMTPKKDASYYQSLMGDRNSMTDKDAELLRKLYCKNGCEDGHVWCGYWANIGFCERSRGYYAYMSTTCKLSCNLC